MPTDPKQLEDENARLKRELQELQNQTKQERSDFESRIKKERDAGKQYTDQIKAKSDEVDSIRSRMVGLTRQLDAEVALRDAVQHESQNIERRLHEMESGQAVPQAGASGKSVSLRTRDDDEGNRDKSQVSTKLMRVVDTWMRTKDLQQALLRGAAITDLAFSTLVQVLADCPSLQTLDLSQNQLTMDSCSDICQLITSAPSLSFISVADNLFSLRSIGYFMTAIMERQNTKKLMPLDLLDLQGNEGIVAAAQAPAPEDLVKQVNAVMEPEKLPPLGAELTAQVMRSLWRFLHDTQHPQVRDTSVDEVAFQAIDKLTLRKMENSLSRMLLASDDTTDGGSSSADAGGGSAGRSLTANFALAPLFEQPADASHDAAANRGPAVDKDAKKDTGMADSRSPSPQAGRSGKQQTAPPDPAQRSARVELRDPFSDLKTAFEPPREKLTTFNLKQIVTKSGTVLMTMLERLLETTEIDARDVETEQTLLEYACEKGNMGLAKLCYRRGAVLASRTKSGNTCLNIVTKNKRYDLMEFLHNYGVKVNHADAEGRTALHVAAANNDLDAVCRLVEWGADVNIRDNRKRTPLHTAAAGGHIQVTMLLLEVGGDINAKDDMEYTTVAHAEANNHFTLMDRLLLLGGKHHGLSQAATKAAAATKATKSLGELTVSAQMLKSSSLGRIGKVVVKGLPGQVSPTMTTGK